MSASPAAAPLGAALVYGATGFSGRAIAAALRAAGREVVVAGRDAGRIQALARELGCAWRCFGLTGGTTVASHLSGIAVVVHAAGPYSVTAGPMIQACLSAGVHYIDLAGEWSVFDLAERLGPQAAQRGVMLMPGAGLSVVATDCLAAQAVAAVPDATLLRVAFSFPPIASRGSVQSALGMVSRGAILRRGGALQVAPAGQLPGVFDFGAGDRRCIAITAPDVITAAHTTGAANIEVYLEAPPAVRLGVMAAAQAVEVLGDAPVRRILSKVGELWPDHPSTASQARSRLTMIVEAVDPWRRATRFGMRTLDGYSVTTRTATAIAARVLDGEHRAGFQTPAAVYGPDLIWSLGCAWPFDLGFAAARSASAASAAFFDGWPGRGEIQ